MVAKAEVILVDVISEKVMAEEEEEEEVHQMKIIRWLLMEWMSQIIQDNFRQRSGINLGTQDVHISKIKDVATMVEEAIKGIMEAKDKVNATGEFSLHKQQK